MLYLFLLAHLVADFVLQPYWLVVRKRHWDGLLIHGAVVLACMLALPLADPRALALWPVMLAITAVHIAADWWKVHRCDALIHPPILPFLLDQVIHMATIIIGLSLTLPAESIWMYGASPASAAAIYGAAYIIAAFATPISVMIWLDPAFKQVALAGQARLRSLLLGAAAVSLILAGGALALPVTLIGLVVVTRRPISAHPLDTPFGMLAVLCIGAVVGAALVLIAA